MSSPLRFSLVFPTFNNQQHINATLASLQNQSYPHWEALIWNDGSTDQTLAVLEACDDPRIRLFSYPRLGHRTLQLGGIWSTLGEALTGDYGCLFGGAWRLRPETLREAAEVLARQPELSLVHGLMEYLDADDRHVEGWRHPTPSYAQGLYRYQMFLLNLVATPTVFFSVARFRRNGGINISRLFAQDYDIWLRLLAQAPGHFIEHPLTQYRVFKHSQSYSMSPHIQQATHRLLPLLSEEMYRRCGFDGLVNGLEPGSPAHWQAWSEFLQACLQKQLYQVVLDEVERLGPQLPPGPLSESTRQTELLAALSSRQAGLSEQLLAQNPLLRALRFNEGLPAEILARQRRRFAHPRLDEPAAEALLARQLERLFDVQLTGQAPEAQELAAWRELAETTQGQAQAVWWHNLGVAAKLAGQDTQAYEYWLKAAHICPDPLSYWNLALATRATDSRQAGEWAQQAARYAGFEQAADWLAQLAPTDQDKPHLAPEWVILAASSDTLALSAMARRCLRRLKQLGKRLRLVAMTLKHAEVEGLPLENWESFSAQPRRLDQLPVMFDELSAHLLLPALQAGPSWMIREMDHWHFSDAHLLELNQPDTRLQGFLQDLHKPLLSCWSSDRSNCEQMTQTYGRPYQWLEIGLDAPAGPSPQSRGLLIFVNHLYYQGQPDSLRPWLDRFEALWPAEPVQLVSTSREWLAPLADYPCSLYQSEPALYQASCASRLTLYFDDSPYRPRSVLELAAAGVDIRQVRSAGSPPSSHLPPALLASNPEQLQAAGAAPAQQLALESGIPTALEADWRQLLARPRLRSHWRQAAQTLPENPLGMSQLEVESHATRLLMALPARDWQAPLEDLLKIWGPDWQASLWLWIEAGQDADGRQLEALGAWAESLEDSRVDIAVFHGSDMPDVRLWSFFPLVQGVLRLSQQQVIGHLAQAHGLPVIELQAESLAAWYRGQAR